MVSSKAHKSISSSPCGTVQIFVRNFGRTLPFDVDLDMTVAKLKGMIQEKLKIPIQYQRLFKQPCHFLEDFRDLKSYDIVKETTLDLQACKPTVGWQLLVEDLQGDTLTIPFSPTDTTAEVHENIQQQLPSFPDDLRLLLDHTELKCKCPTCTSGNSCDVPFFQIHPHVQDGTTLTTALRQFSLTVTHPTGYFVMFFIDTDLTIEDLQDLIHARFLEQYLMDIAPSDMRLLHDDGRTIDLGLGLPNFLYNSSIAHETVLRLEIISRTASEASEFDFASNTSSTASVHFDVGPEATDELDSE